MQIVLRGVDDNVGGKVEVDVCCAPITKYLAVQVLRTQPTHFLACPRFDGAIIFLPLRRLPTLSRKEGKILYAKCSKVAVDILRLKIIRRDRFIPELQVSD